MNSKSYWIRPLVIQEVTANDGFTHIATFTAADLTTAVANTPQALNFGPIPAGSNMQVEMRVSVPFEDTLDPAFNSLTVSFGDDTSPTSLLAATQIGAGAGKVYNDGATNSNTTVTSATAAFVAGDVGKRISGGSIPAGATIASVTNGTTVVISAAATTTATGVTITLADRSSTPVVTPVVRGAFSTVYTADNNLNATFTGLPASKNLNSLKKGQLDVLVKVVNPNPILNIKGTASVAK